MDTKCSRFSLTQSALGFYKNRTVRIGCYRVTAIFKFIQCNYKYITYSYIQQMILFFCLSLYTDFVCDKPHMYCKNKISIKDMDITKPLTTKCSNISGSPRYDTARWNNKPFALYEIASPTNILSVSLRTCDDTMKNISISMLHDLKT